MSRRITSLLILLIVLIVLEIKVLSSAATKIDPYAKISMLDVGQGDSFLIQAPNDHQLLIDGGPSSKVLEALTKVMPLGDHYIDVVIATHPDADHIGGLSFVLDRYRVGLFLTSETKTDTQVFASLFQKIKEKKIPAFYARRGMEIILDQKNWPQTKASILFPDRPTLDWKTNNSSVVTRVEITNINSLRSALFMGDAPEAIEHFLALTQPQEIKTDILKLGHHGSKTSSSEEFLRATSPGLALISAGANNRYGHPAVETLNRLKSLAIPYLSTIEKGTVVLESDGKSWLEAK